MSELRKLSEMGSDCEVQSVSHLISLYDNTIDQLRVCAVADPDPDTDSAVGDKREDDLLDFEANLLDQAAQLPLSSKHDLLKMMDFWAQVSGIDVGEEVSPSDRIVMNIFRHIVSAKLAA